MEEDRKRVTAKLYELSNILEGAVTLREQEILDRCYLLASENARLRSENLSLRQKVAALFANWATAPLHLSKQA